MSISEPPDHHKLSLLARYLGGEDAAARWRAQRHEDARRALLRACLRDRAELRAEGRGLQRLHARLDALQADVDRLRAEELPEALAYVARHTEVSRNGTPAIDR
jgi:hypothetical protein